MATISMARSMPRRPLLLVVSALLILAAALGLRFWQDAATPEQTAPQRTGRMGSATADEYTAQLRARIEQNSDDVEAYALLGLMLLQQVRETVDSSLYLQAEQAFAEALRRDPKNVEALVGQGMLALARHDFAEGLRLAEEAWPLNPYRAQTLGVKVDALVELGRYPEAIDAAQQMVDLRPDLSSYSRISYLRELHGDVEGAITVMEMAVKSAAPGSEPALWTTVQLGHLYFNRGDLAQAEQVYRQALAMRDDYPYALAGMARVRAAQGEVEAAIDQVEWVVERLPLPEFVIALGELYEAAGQMEKAQEQYDLVRVIQQLNSEAGMNVDLEMALFDADHGSDPASVVVQATAAYHHRPSIYAADTLAWALYRAGQTTEAQQYSTEALRLETQDARLYYHAGMIAYKLGDAESARTHLRRALEINPYFSPLYAPVVEQLLAEPGE